MSDRCATAELLDEAIEILGECWYTGVSYNATARRIRAFLDRVEKYDRSDEMIYFDGEFQPVESRYECDEQ